jgi:signal peptidase II
MRDSVPQRWVPFSIAAVVFAVDRFTKWIVETQVSAYDTLQVIPGFFAIVHSQNRGAAFGILADSPSEWRTFFLIVVSAAALVFVASMVWRGREMDRPTLWGLTLIMGGALGNVFDRVTRGTVTDFLLFYVGEYQWPAFNVADSAITVGSVLLLLELLRPRKEPART